MTQGRIQGAMRHYNYDITVDLGIEECCNCGLVFAMPVDWQRRRKDKRDTFYCPAGHPQHYVGQTDAEKERAKRIAAEARADQASATAREARQQRDAARRSASALKGHITRMRNRIANGVCPVPGCKRSGFSNVMRHIASKHPAWHHDHADDLS